MPTLQNGSGALRINVPRGSSLIIRNQSGVETVTGSSASREDATYALGSGAFVYGPQTASSDLSISTTGVLTYDIVAGDPTPASTPAQVTRSASTGSPTGLIDPATGQPVGSGGGAVGVGLVAGRMRPPSIQRTDAPYQSGMGYVRQIAKDDITEVMIATATWYLQNGVGETPFGGDVQYTCGFHDLKANKTQITWAGSASVIQADNTNTFSDWVTLTAPIKRGQTFFVKTWGKSVSGAAMAFVGSFPAYGPNWGDACQIGSASVPVADMTMTSAIPGGNGFGWQVMPVMIYGRTARGAVVLIGTSIAQGQSDSPNDGYGLFGRTERQIARYWGTANFGCGATSASGQNTGNRWTRRKELLDKLTVPVAIVSEHVTNDFAGGRTSAQVYADLATIRGILGREFFIQGDCLPRTDGANNLDATFQAKRATFNTDLPTLPSGLDGYFVDSPLVESAATAGTWANGPAAGMPDTGDGIHPSSNAGKKFQDAENAAKAVRAVLGD